MQMLVDGKMALAAGRQISAFDGEISGTNSYIYGTDYRLGDKVELIDRDGESSHMRVTEVILSMDEAGTKAYPTLEWLQTATPGTWSALTSDSTWDSQTTATWADPDPIT